MLNRIEWNKSMIVVTFDLLSALFHLYLSLIDHIKEVLLILLNLEHEYHFGKSMRHFTRRCVHFGDQFVLPNEKFVFLQFSYDWTLSWVILENYWKNAVMRWFDENCVWFTFWFVRFPQKNIMESLEIVTICRNKFFSAIFSFNLGFIDSWWKDLFNIARWLLILTETWMSFWTSCHRGDPPIKTENPTQIFLLFRWTRFKYLPNVFTLVCIWLFNQ